MQSSLFGELDAAELSRVRSVLQEARRLCMRLLLSPHNFGRYIINGSEAPIGSSTVPVSAFTDFWKRMSMAFLDDCCDELAFGLMNEPHDFPGWANTAQAAVDSIRSVSRKRLILVPGDAWSNAWRWANSNPGFPVRDPEERVIYEAHQYFDADHTGTYKLNYEASRAYPDIGIDLVRPFADWLHQSGRKGVLGEFGVPNNDLRWLELTDRLLSWLANHQVGWVYWAGGLWWGNYPLSAEPRGDVDAPIMKVLTRYTSTK